MRLLITYVLSLVFSAAIAAPASATSHAFCGVGREPLVFAPGAGSISYLEKETSASAVVDCAECGEAVSYTTWKGKTVPLRRLSGRYVAILVPEKWFSRADFTPDIRRRVVDGADMVYDYFKDLTGAEPQGNGLLPVAFVDEPGCGYGCGIIGRKGVEIADDSCCGWNGNAAVFGEGRYGLAQNAIVHEIAHNFDVHYSGKLGYTGDTAHAWTSLINWAFYTWTRLGTTPFTFVMPNHSPDELLRHLLEATYWEYIDTPSFSWTSCFQNNDCNYVSTGAPNGRQDTYASFMHRFGELEGPGFMRRYIRSIKDVPAIPNTAVAREDHNVLLLSHAAKKDLSPCIERLRWTASPAVRATMAAAYPETPEYCMDRDGDGYAVINGDPLDSNATARPGGSEVPNGFDDDGNGVADEHLYDDATTPYSQNWTAPTRVQLPARITGTAPASKDLWFEAPLAAGERVRFTICSPSFDGFEGGVWAEDGQHWERKETTHAWTKPGQCATGLAEYATAQEPAYFSIRGVSRGGPFVLTIEPLSYRWPAPNPQSVEVTSVSGNAYTFVARGTSEGMIAPPQEVRFYVSRVGWIGSVPWSEDAELQWQPPAPLPRGTYAVTAQAYSDEHPVGRISEWVDFDVSLRSIGDSGTRMLILPAVAKADGLNGTRWRSDVVLHNPSASGAVATMWLLNANSDNTAVAGKAVFVPAGGSLLMQDIIGGEFALNAGSGGLLVQSAAHLTVTSRTFNDGGGGTYGQFVGGVELPPAATPELIRKIYLTQLTENDAYRTNLGFVNTDFSPASVDLTLFSSTGTVLGSSRVELLPWSYRQLRSLSALNVTPFGQGYVEVSVSSGRVTAYASVIDNISGDPIYVLGRTAISGDQVIPAAARTQGSFGTDWKTDLDLTNTGFTAAVVTIDLLNGNPVAPRRTVPIGPGQSTRVANVIGDLFNTEGVAALRVSSPVPVIATTRTYTGAPGTYGQFVGASEESSAIRFGEAAHLVQLRNVPGTAGFRTNVGFTNVGSHSLAVAVEVRTDAGASLGSFVTTVAPNTVTQLNPFDRIASGSHENAIAIIRTTTPGGVFHTYASVVDNASGDPVYMPASHGQDRVIRFGAGLDECVRYRAGVAAGEPILTSSISRLFALNCSGFEVTSLDGIEKLPLLRSVEHFRPGNLRLDPFPKLPLLRTLVVMNQGITDVSPAADLPAIDYLNLSQNYITDVSPLASFVETPRDLVLSHNEIENIAPLAAKSFQNLNLYGNRISDLSPFLQLPWNERYGGGYIDLRQNLIGSSSCPAVAHLLQRGTSSISITPQKNGELTCP